MTGIPTGTVTFIFTDIEGSTNLWEHHAEVMQREFARQESLLREVFAAYGGYTYKMIGDAFQVAFATAPVALSAAIEAQRLLQAEPWEGPPIRVRMALHTGVTDERGDDYVGPVLNRVARLLSTGHGGQILLTQVTHELVRDDLPPGMVLRDMGEHRLKDLIRPERVYQVVATGLPESFPPLKTLDAYPHNLPIQLTSFVGREKEMAEVKRLFMAESGGRLVTLTGPGGTGKTRLSLHVAADLLERFPQGVWLVELAALTDAALVPQAIAGVLGVRENSGRPPLAALIEHLRPQRLLLILDNCEHLVDACARAVESLLRACPQVSILASSRELLGIEGEAPYRVPSLSIPDLHNLPPVERLSHYEAVRLFIERATLVAPGFTVTNANAPALAEVCQRLDGIPLAIELVAARAALLSVEQITVRLNNVFRLLSGGSRTALPRHQTIRALIDWSYDMLSPAEQTLLQRLSVFKGGWDLESAEAVCAEQDVARLGAAGLDPLEILDLLAQLVNKSLVQVERQRPGETRYRLLETIRQYAQGKLTADELARAQRQHMRYYLGLADRPDAELRGPEQVTWIERFEANLDNLRAALETAASEDVEAGLSAAAALLWFWHIRGYSGEGLRQYERLLAAEAAQRGDQPPTPQRAVARARALNAAGFFHYSYQIGSNGTDLLEESLALLAGAQGADTRRETAWAYLNLGRFALNAQDFNTGRACYEKALPLYESAADRFGAAECLTELGIVAMVEGRFGPAQTALAQSLALRRASGDLDGIAFDLASLAELAFLQADHPRALQLLTESMALFRQARNRILTDMSLDFLSLIHWMMGDPAAAVQVYREAHPEDLADEDQVLDIEYLARQGEIALSLGQYAEARTALTQALDQARQPNHPLYQGQMQLALGRLAWAEGDLAQAQSWLEASRAESTAYNYVVMVGLADCCLARLALARGDERRAVELIRQALPLFHMPYHHWLYSLGLELLLALAAKHGQGERAARLYGAGETLFTSTRRYRSPAEIAQLEDSLSAARACLGEVDFNRLVSEGRAVPILEAAADGLQIALTDLS